MTPDKASLISRELEGEEKSKRACVTGAGGYVASFLVQLLLSKGYTVHGTVRNPDDEKNSHLKKLDKASENLLLFKANLLDYDSLLTAITGCNGVFHVASPIPEGTVANPEIELIEPAVMGTLNVLKACSTVGITRVIIVSSIAAIAMNPNWPADKVMDEDCWSDKEYCRTKTDSLSWYCLSKVEAECKALEYAEKKGLDVITVCPSWIIGPLLQPNVNVSSIVLVTLLKGKLETTESIVHAIVDVRDVADALLLVYEKPEASGRYICSSQSMHIRDFISKLRSIYPNYNYPKNFTDAVIPWNVNTEKLVNLSSEKLKKLGWKCRTLEETLVDAVQCFQKSGLLDKE